MEPTWYVRPEDGKRVLVLDVHSSLEDGGPDDYEVAVVEMTPEYAKDLLRRIELVKQWKQLDDQLCDAEFWNYDLQYFPADWEEAPDDDRTPPPLWEARGEYDGRTDTDLLEVSERYVEWHAYVKNTDIRLHSESLSVDDLMRYASGDDPWRGGDGCSSGAAVERTEHESKS